MSIRKYAKTSIWVTIILITGYVLSFIKEAVIANYYGVSSSVDAYTIALTIPVTLFALISVAIQSVVIPIYSKLLYNTNKEEANKYASNLITIVSFFSLIIILLCELFASPLSRVFAPGFNEETLSLTTSLLRITLPTIIFSLIDKILIGILNVHKRFIIPSFSVYLLNIGLILSILLLHAQFGIIAACIGQVVGSILQVVFLYSISKNIYHYKFVFSLRDNNLNKSLKQSLPIIWSVGIAEICAIINRIVASFLFVGSISALGYAAKINGIISTFFTAAISTIIYPLYAESTAKNDIKQLNSRINFTLSVYSLFLIPSMLGILCYRQELVKLVFGRGAFDDNAVLVTQSILGCYCIGLPFMAFRETITKVFYSLQDSKTPATNATIGVCINIILNISLPFILGVEGLAIATSITATIISISLLKQLMLKHDEINLRNFWSNIKPIVCSALAMFVVLLLLNYLLHDFSAIIRMTIGFSAGIITYTIFLSIFKASVWNNIKSIIFKNH